MACSRTIENFIGMCDSPIIHSALSARKLRITPIKGTQDLLMDCTEKATATNIYQDRPIIHETITQLRIPRLQIAVQGVVKLTITAQLDTGVKLMVVQPQTSDNTKRAIDFVMNCPHVSTITAMFTDVSLFVNGKGSKDRLIWSPARYIGLNYRHFWRDSMDDYERLYRELRQNGKVDNFRYRLRRVDDSMAEYVANYQVMENVLGETVRIAENFEWRLISPQ